MPALTLSVMPMANLLKEAGLVTSTSEANRMVKQGAVKIDGVKCEDNKQELAVGGEFVVQVGKRKFSRITIADTNSSD